MTKTDHIMAIFHEFFYPDQDAMQLDYTKEAMLDIVLILSIFSGAHVLSAFISVIIISILLGRDKNSIFLCKLLQLG